MDNNHPKQFFLKVPDLPQLKTLRIYFTLIGVGTASAFFLPISLSLNFDGKMASDGPSSQIKAPTNSVIKKIAPENEELKNGTPLFKFIQPIMLAETKIKQTRLTAIRQQIKSSTNECISVDQILKQNLEHANQYFALKRNAFQLEAISRLNLLSARGELDTINREIAIHKQRCSQDLEQLIGQEKISKEELEKQISLIKQSESITAPSNGYLHRINVKNNQNVSSGEVLALFTSEGTAGAMLTIPLKDRPFVEVGDKYLISSNAYQILNNPPIRECLITSISPDSFKDDQISSIEINDLTYQAQCKFQQSPLKGQYPFLVGMQVSGSATSVKTTLIQIILEGYRRTLVSQQKDNNHDRK
tara:strand:+ start:5589 stop:6668 length:1080 start_codon:yes stop_codon:yes gene_type:complete